MAVKETKNKKRFFKDFKAELKKVIWPTPKQIVNSTVAVITIVLVTTAIVFALDLVFEKFNEYGVDNLKKEIERRQTNNEVVENTSIDVNNTVVNDVENAADTTNNSVDNTSN